MPGAIGLLGRPQNDRIPEHRLVSSCPTLDVFDLHRKGLLTGDYIVVGTDGDGSRPPAAPGTSPTSDGSKSQMIRVVPHPVVQVLFLCPTCDRARWRLRLFEGRWQCVKCARLVYSSNSRCQRIVGYDRAIYLRRRMGVSPVPFSEIEPRPLRADQWWQQLLELRRIEAGLIEQLRTKVGDVLERRLLSNNPVAHQYARRHGWRDRLPPTRGAEAARRAADAYGARVYPIVQEIQASGITKPGDIAAELIRRNVLTPRGGQWNAKAVRRYAQRNGWRLDHSRSRPRQDGEDDRG